MADLKPVYRAVSKEAAESTLDELKEKWGAQYPVVLQSWRKKWDNLSHYFRYPATIRKVIYMTNAIESVHRQFRKQTKTKGAFPNEQSVEASLSGINERTGKMDNAAPELESDIVPVGDLF